MNIHYSRHKPSLEEDFCLLLHSPCFPADKALTNDNYLTERPFTNQTVALNSEWGNRVNEKTSNRLQVKSQGGGGHRFD